VIQNVEMVHLHMLLAYGISARAEILSSPFGAGPGNALSVNMGASGEFYAGFRLVLVNFCSRLLLFCPLCPDRVPHADTLDSQDSRKRFLFSNFIFQNTKINQ